MTTHPTWHFHPVAPGMPRIEPTSHEHFQQAGLSDVEALVRELVQNGSDRPDDETAHVTLRLVNVLLHDLSPLLADLWPRVERCFGPLDVSSEDEVLCLIASDDNVGLEGDPTSDSWDTHPDDRWGGLLRMSGESPKEGESGGSTGNGKETYRFASGFGCFLVLTRRADEVEAGVDRLLLSGAATLKHHELDEGGRFFPFGRLVRADADGVEPLEDQTQIASLLAPLGLFRPPGESGTDVVIPHVAKEDVSASALIEAACRHFFPPILAGELIIRVVDEAGEEILIDRDSIVDVVLSRLERPDDLVGDLALYRDGLQQAKDGTILVIDAGEDGRPDLDALDDEKRAMLRDRLRVGETLATEMRFRFTCEGEEHEGGVHVLLREEERRRGTPHYQRGPLAICGVQTNRHLTPGHRSIVDVREGVVAQACRLSEPPAHTDWRQNRPQYKRSGYPQWLIMSVKRAAARLLSAILDEDDSSDTTAAEAFFGVAEPDPLPGTGGGGDGGDDPPPGPNPPDGSRDVRLGRTSDGFSVTVADDAVCKELLVRVAYSVRRGDPFRRHLPADFSLKDRSVAVRLRGGVIVEESHHTARVRIDDPGSFHLRVTGFDRSRSLAVKVDPVDPEEGESA